MANGRPSTNTPGGDKVSGAEGQRVIFGGPGRKSDNAGGTAHTGAHQHRRVNKEPVAKSPGVLNDSDVERALAEIESASQSGGNGNRPGDNGKGGAAQAGTGDTSSDIGSSGKPELDEAASLPATEEAPAPSFTVTEQPGEEVIPKWKRYYLRRKAREAALKAQAAGVAPTQPSGGLGLDASTTATMIVETLSNFAVALVRPEAAMSDAEKKSMQEPLARTISRFQPQLASTLAKYADPVALVIAFGLWGNRVRELSKSSPPVQSPSSAPQPNAPDIIQPEPPEAIRQVRDIDLGITPLPPIITEHMRGVV